MQSYSRYQIATRSNIPFSREDYSRFKYGSKRIAREFGRDLAHGFVDSKLYADINSNVQIVVMSSPYSFIPTATYAMKDYFIATLNMSLIADSMKPVQECKVVRTHSYIEDYGEMSADRRHELIGREAFHIDKDFLIGKHLLFLDDIKITGAHQRGMEEMISRLGITESATFLYYAELTSLTEDPNIENYLNYAAVDSLLHLNNIIQNDEFMFNTRCVKYMLNSNPNEFHTFIQYQSKSFRETLLTCAVGNSYHLVPDYATNFQTLFNIVSSEH